MDKKLNIIVKNDLEELGKIEEAIETISRDWQIDISVISTVNLILEEVFTNVVFHGYEDKDTHHISIKFACDSREIKITVKSDGKEFNPLEMPEVDTTQDLYERPIGGLGVHFLKKMSDSVNYTFLEGMNILSFTKRLEK